MGISDVEKYLELCRAVSVENTHLRGYRHELLEELICLPIFDDLYKQLKKHERQAISGYLKYLKHGQEWGFFKASIPLLEEAVQALIKLYQKELNARWVLRDKKTGLYWAAILFPPYWRSRHAAFLFDEHAAICNLKLAKRWLERFNKTAGGKRFELVRIDATKRLERWRKKHLVE